jgi:hypothetical protein
LVAVICVEGMLLCSGGLVGGRRSGLLKGLQERREGLRSADE